jgi:hypothetical protein
VDGHFAFVGRVVSGEGQMVSGRFKYAISTRARTHPTTQATYGNSDTMVDLEFFIESVPEGL